MKSILKKLNIIQAKLSVPKNQFNNFGKYKYRSLEDILEAVKPLLEETKTVLTISDEPIQIGDRYYIKAIAEITCSETNESILAAGYAREEESKKGMDSSQLTGSTSSYARKYACNGLFSIDDSKDSDYTNRHDTEKHKTSTQLSDAQIKRLYAIANAAEIGADIVKATAEKNYKVTSLKDLTRQQYDEFCNKLEEQKK